VIHAAGPGDPRLDSYRHVGDPAWLAERHLVAEGRLVVERLLAATHYEVLSIVVTPAALHALSARVETARWDVYVCDRSVLADVTGFDFHRGCLALGRRPPRPPVADLLGARRLVAMEGVGNPDNVGGIFRTAAALGAGGVVLDPASGDPFYRKAIRTSMGATLSVPWVRLDPWPTGLDGFQRERFTLVALTTDAAALALEEFAAHLTDAGKLMLLLGGEGPGLSESVLQRADVRVRIPIDPAVDSLNVVVAAGIALERLRPRPDGSR
jgi:tRNA G18 (ribose-2'-O)-methylase SpoU